LASTVPLTRSESLGRCSKAMFGSRLSRAERRATGKPRGTEPSPCELSSCFSDRLGVSSQRSPNGVATAADSKRLPSSV